MGKKTATKWITENIKFKLFLKGERSVYNYLQKSCFMPTIDYPIHVRVADKKTNNSIWNNRHHLQQKLPIILFDTRITSQIIFCAHRKLITE